LLKCLSIYIQLIYVLFDLPAIQEKPFTMEVAPAMMTPKRKVDNEAAKQAAVASSSKKLRKAATPEKKTDSGDDESHEDDIESEEQ
jgi:hypothetical protein